MAMQQSEWLKDFKCLGDKCEDTCCKGWGMQLDDATLARYREAAPELMGFVTQGESDHVMMRDEETDYCVKFDQGWCAIQKEKGSDFLGDACHFFPRVTRQLGDITIQTATLSCPEAARKALLDARSALWHESEPERLPYALYNYLPDGLMPQQAMQIHESFLTAAIAEDAMVGKIVARLHSVAQSLMSIDVSTWPMAVDFYLKNADSRLTQPEARTEDPFQLYHALAGLVRAAKPSSRPRLQRVLTTMQDALDVRENGGDLSFGNHSLPNLQQMRDGWKFINDQWQPYLKRWLQVELAVALFPFSGFGDTLVDRITIIGVRLATLKLALQCHLYRHQSLHEDEFVEIVQSLARFLDHLADPALSMQIYQETGWVKTPRLWGLFAA